MNLPALRLKPLGQRPALPFSSIVIFGQRQPTVTLKLKDVDVFTALDMICLVERTFWIPVGDHTIFIVEDNSTKRRDFDLTFVDVVHLTGAKTSQDVNDVMNVVRQT